MLDEAGFRRLSETDEWQIKSGDKCYVSRNGTSVIAFRSGTRRVDLRGIRLIGTHIDSPCLKLTPKPVYGQHGYFGFNVEVYGSALLRTWFDRDLSLAGRVFHRKSSGKVISNLIDFKDPIAVIPSIAIHLERDANKRQKINSQIHINPVSLLSSRLDSHARNSAESDRFESVIYRQLAAQGIEIGDKKLLGFDLRFYDTNPPKYIGRENYKRVGPLRRYESLPFGYLSSARIDNLLSCYAGVQALIETDQGNTCMLVCSDHEEVGSMSDTGAQGSFLDQVLKRAVRLDPALIRRSVMISADGAHALHPNYPEKHDKQHGPRLNNGPVIKVNANQRYATSDETESLIRNLCESHEIPLQEFVSRNDMPCGTTIGPLVAAQLGIRTVDVGVAQFAMHSARELAGVGDTIAFRKLLKAFYDAKDVTYID